MKSRKHAVVALATSALTTVAFLLPLTAAATTTTVTKEQPQHQSQQQQQQEQQQHNNNNNNNYEEITPSSSSSSSLRRKLTDDNDDETNEHPPIRANWPELAWLTAYPQSRAMYTMKVLHEVTHKTTAVNYRNHYRFPGDVGDAYPSDDNGPYPIKQNLPFPDRYILTETHCVGTCLGRCRKDVYVKNVRNFFLGCASGRYTEEDEGGDPVPLYDTAAVGKVVHQIRDPFDNVVHRFLDECRDFRRRGGKCPYELNRRGLLNWCHDFNVREDVVAGMALNDILVSTLASQIPCYGVFYQFVLWHNNVADVIKENSIPALALHHDDFMRDMEGTVSALLEFLDLPRVTKELPRPPQPDDYSTFFSQTERGMVSSFVKVLAAQQTWRNLKRYLPAPDYEPRFSPLGSALSPRHYGKWPGVAWLMTFPNSGTGYVSQITQRLSGGTTTASNYGNEMGGNFVDIPNFAYTDTGPFRTGPQPFPKGFILTKTHCKHCMNCHPWSNDYEIKLEEFIEGCTRTGVMQPDGKAVMGHYDTSITKKMVHVIRNPFDNIVANFHYQYKRDVRKIGHSEYSYNRDGFRKWCNWHDAKYKEEDFFLYGKEAAEVAKSIPCHGVLYQYIQWHDNAFRTPIKLKIPSLVMYYEDFHFDRKGIIDRLLKFLQLKKEKNAPPFYYSPYPDHYTQEELRHAQTFMMMVGSVETNKALERYFKYQDDDSRRNI